MAADEDEDLQIAFYKAVRADLIVRVIDDQFELTPKGKVRARVLAMEHGAVNPDAMTEAQALAYVTEIVT